jgi:hypothetical protein
MLRCLLPFVLVSAPAFAQGNPFCILTLKACDYDREDSGVCPEGTAATATLWAEGDYWYLDTVGVTADPADGPSTAEERLRIVNTGDTGDGTRVYYILARQGLDGVFLLGADGAARISITGDAGPDRTAFESHFIGQCEVPQP